MSKYLTETYFNHLLEGVDNTFESFRDISRIIKSKMGFDTAYMGLMIQNACFDKDGRIDMSRPTNRCAGSWTRNKMIYIGSIDHIEKVMRTYGISTDVNPYEFQKFILAHELGHEIYNNLMDDDQRTFYKKKLKSFHTTYTKYVEGDRKSALDEEKFCEYVATVATRTL